MSAIGGPLKSGRRAASAMVAIALETIHPNPGPVARDKSERGKAKRREWRKSMRKEKRELRARLAAQEITAAGPAPEKKLLVPHSTLDPENA